MRAVDTHAHLDFPHFDHDRQELIALLEKEELGVINIATSLESVEKVVELTKNRLVWAAIGVHPTDITHEVNVQLPAVIEGWKKLVASNPKIVAVGEVGLDYYREASRQTASLQKAALRQLITFAHEAKLPIIFHCRAAYGDLLVLAKDYKITGVVHCFSGTSVEAKAFLDRGLNLSFTGNVSYPNSELLLDAIKATPIEKIMLETDCPFLAPQNIRGKRNDPRTIFEVARIIAEIKGVDVNEVVEATTTNAIKLFRLDQSATLEQGANH